MRSSGDMSVLARFRDGPAAWSEFEGQGESGASDWGDGRERAEGSTKLEDMIIVNVGGEERRVKTWKREAKEWQV